MKKIFTIFLLLLSSLPGFGQFNSGLTNKIIIKTDITYWLLGSAINAEAEIKIKDQLSLNIGFYLASQQYNQYYNASEYAGGGLIFSNPTITLPDKGTINSKYISIGVRKYLDRILKAPFGFYWSATVAGGLADLGGDYDAWLFDKNVQRGDLGTNSPGPEVNYSYFNVPLAKVQLGYGYQGMLGQHICWDAGICFDYNQFIVASTDDAKKISGLTRNFGTMLNLGTGAGGVGFSALVKLGYLIY